MRFTRKGFDDGRIHVMVEEDAGTSDAEWEEDTHLGPVDRVLGCTGWVFDTSIFDEATAPAMWTRRYPGLTPGFESTNVPGLFFAGTLMHGRDHRRSSGGFIHGFRYLTRALHRQLELRHHGVPWPAAALPVDVGALTMQLLRRINEMDGGYQMFGVLVDIARP